MSAFDPVAFREKEAANKRLPCAFKGCACRRFGLNRYCEPHATERARVGREAARKALETRRQRYPHRFVKAGVVNPNRWRSLAAASVALAIRGGLLPKLDGSVACVDCAGPASEYEHRDYRLPLAVEPVCRSCNNRRGSGRYPCADDFAHIKPRGEG